MSKKMLRQYSIKNLYPLALAEGEGVGTAYEYFTKRLLLARWLKGKEQPRHILVAGLPEKYGASLDFLLIASDLGASVTVVDDNPQALTNAKEALSKAQKERQLQNIEPEYCQVGNMGSLDEIDGPIDLVLSSETLQRLSVTDQNRFIIRLIQLAPLVAIFTPNYDNPAHTDHSGLSGLRLDELDTLIKQGRQLANEESDGCQQTDYIDMPPFPPGITRSEEQREQAISGKGEAIAMWGLGYFARLERFLPRRWRRKKSHIVFALIRNSQR